MIQLDLIKIHNLPKKCLQHYEIKIVNSMMSNLTLHELLLKINY